MKYQEFHKSLSFVWDFSLEHNLGITFILEKMLLDSEALKNVWGKAFCLEETATIPTLGSTYRRSYFRIHCIYVLLLVQKINSLHIFFLNNNAT